MQWFNNIKEAAIHRHRNQLLCIIFLVLTFLFLPFHFDFLLYNSSFGLRNAFTNFFSGSFLDVTELFFLLSFLFCANGFHKKNDHITFPKWMTAGIILLFFGLIISMGTSIDSTIHILRIRYFIYMVLLLWMMLHMKKHLSWPALALLLVGGFEACLMILQFLNNGSVGLHFLGEVQFSSLELGVAKLHIGTEQFVRPYGTFLHPNIAAAFLLLTLMLSTFFAKELKKNIGKLYYLLIILLVLGILISFSKSAYFLLGTFAIVSGIYIYSKKLYKKNILQLILPITCGIALLAALIYGLIVSIAHFFDMSTVLERFRQAEEALRLFLSHPFGIGLGNFTLLQGVDSGVQLYPWEYQPVHNIYLLLLTETGVIGVFGFVVVMVVSLIELLKKSLKKSKLQRSSLLLFAFFSVFFLGMVDHYIITSFPIFILFIFILGLPLTLPKSK